MPASGNRSIAPIGAQATAHHPLRALAAAAALLAFCVAMLSVAHATPPTKFSAALVAGGPLRSGAHYRTEQAAMEIDRLTIRPGGSSGWHSHSGPLIVIVKQGTMTNFLAGRHGCVRSKLIAGHSYLEPANTAHLAINEGTRNVVFYAIVNYRKGGDSADDAKRPAGCHA